MILHDILKSNDKKDLVKAESTWLEPAVQSKKELINWILVGLGWPLITVELSEDQLNYCILNALEKYTKYAYMGPDKYLVVDLDRYEPGKGLDLHEFHILSVKDMSFGRDAMMMLSCDPFWGTYAVMGAVGGGNGGYNMFSGFSNGAVGAWTTWHAVSEYFDLVKRMTGSNPDWQWDKYNLTLKIMPEPHIHHHSKHCNYGKYALVTCQVQPKLEDLYGNEYVKRLCMAYAKILLGTVRSKFTGVQLPGGGQLNTDIGSLGQTELDKIMEEIQKDESFGQSFYIV